MWTTRFRPPRTRTTLPAGEPVRTCIGCRRRAAQSELVRIVAASDGLVISRTAPGRGAWLCRTSASCIELAVRQNAFSRALRTSVAPGLVEAVAAELPARRGEA